MKRLLKLSVAVLPILMLAVPASAQDAAAEVAIKDFTPITEDVINNPAPEDWLMFRRTLNAWNHSPLEQITKENVGQLQLAWSAPMEVGTIEETPLVYNGVMYLLNPGSVITALDATTGDLLWEYRRQLPEGVSATGALRNIAIFDNKIYHSTPDAYLIALDAQTGQLAWETQIGDYNQSLNASSGPLIVKGKVIKTVPESQIVETLIEEAMRLAESMPPVDGAEPQVTVS